MESMITASTGRRKGSGPHLVLFSGPPGVGKSSLSYRLAHETGWVVAAKDLFDQTLKLHGPAHYPSTLAYDLMFDLGALNLSLGVSVILDAVFPRQAFRTRAMELAVEHRAQFHAVVCWCSDRVLWRQRVESRQQMVPGWTPADWAEVERVAGYYEPWTTPRLTLDATAPFEENAAALLKAVMKL